MYFYYADQKQTFSAFLENVSRLQPDRTVGGEAGGGGESSII